MNDVKHPYEAYIITCPVCGGGYTHQRGVEVDHDGNVKIHMNCEICSKNDDDIVFFTQIYQHKGGTYVEKTTNRGQRPTDMF